MAEPIRQTWLATLDKLDESTATFCWYDGDTVDRVWVSVPRNSWEERLRPSVITVVLAEPTGR